MYAPLSLSQSISPVQGEQVSLKATEGKHFIDFEATLESIPTPTTPSDSVFYNNLMDTFNSLNKQVITADQLTEEFLVNPEKVNVHDVMIALQKSKLNLDLTRTVIQKSIDGYNTIINLR